MNAIILAGGKSSRMGQDKAFIKVEGQFLIKRQIALLKKIFKNIIIVTNQPAKFKFKGIKVVQDIIKGCGPLSGIHAGLKASGSNYNFVIACDMPFISEPLIRYMLKEKKGYDVVIPRIRDKFHPLFGIYSKNCVSVIEERLRRGRFNVSGIFKKLKSRFIPENKIAGFDPDGRALMNLNYKSDLKTL